MPLCYRMEIQGENSTIQSNILYGIKRHKLLPVTCKKRTYLEVSFRKNDLLNKMVHGGEIVHNCIFVWGKCPHIHILGREKSPHTRFEKGNRRNSQEQIYNQFLLGIWKFREGYLTVT